MITVGPASQLGERKVARRGEQGLGLMSIETHGVGDSQEILPPTRSSHPAFEPVDDRRLGHAGQPADQTRRIARRATHLRS
jgi:hypothetical protein